MLTDRQMEELVRRSQDGEAVMAILESMGINRYTGTDWLQRHRRDEVIAAKKEQIRRKKEKDEKKDNRK